MNRFLLLVTGLLLVTPSSPAAVPVTDGLLLWLDATDPDTLFQDSTFTTPASPGDPIGGWMDKSGNDFFAFQDDVNRQPVWNATAMNGQPALRFSGFQNDGMAIDEGLYLERPYTVFIVNQYWDEPNRGRTLQGQDENWLVGLWGRRMGAYANPWVGLQNAPLDVPVVVDTTGDVDESTLTINGTDFTDDSITPMGAPGRLGLVSVGLYPDEVSDADISEVVVYDRVLSPTELSEVRGYLYSKYEVGLIDELLQNVVHQGAFGLFTGGDPGEGLDLEGSFAYAVNVGGPGGLAVGDAEFTDGSLVGMQSGSSPGATIAQTNEANPWTYVGEYGDTPNDNNLEVVMQSIRWSDFTVQPPLDVELVVEEGMPYRMQLLFAEGVWDRGFDITVEGERVVEAFNIGTVQESYYPDNADRAVVYTLDLIAQDELLNISLGGVDLRSPDNNPLLQGLTLELLPGTPPLEGDYNNNGELDAGDLDLQASDGIKNQNLAYDLNGDGVVDYDGDRVMWLHDLKKAPVGDADLDRSFTSNDFVQVFIAGLYETGSEAKWGEGDWNGDLVFGSSDFVAAFTDGYYEQGPFPDDAGLAAVPEPTTTLLSLIGITAVIAWRRRR